MTWPLVLRTIRDRRAVAVPEFGLIAIPLFTLLMGATDLGYQAYVRTVALGALETATRQVLLQNANATTIENGIRTQIRAAMPRATVNIVRGSFNRFGAMNNMERLTLDLNSNGVLDGPVDTDGNGVADKSDCWEDVDNNSLRNVVTVGRDSIGGADDIIRYTVTITYPRLLPIWRMVGVGSQATVSATSMVRRQPYENQPQPAVRCA